MRLAALVMLVCVLAIGVALAEPRGEGPTRPLVTGSFVRGVALGLFATDPEWDYGPLVDEIRARGATDVLVVVNAYPPGSNRQLLSLHKSVQLWDRLPRRFPGKLYLPL